MADTHLNNQFYNSETQNNKHKPSRLPTFLARETLIPLYSLYYLLNFFDKNQYKRRVASIFFVGSKWVSVLVGKIKCKRVNHLNRTSAS